MADQPIIIKKKIVKGHGHHGGSWKVAYADFVTAMMAFFMVMWIMSMSTDTKDQIQGYFNDPLGFTNASPKTLTMKTLDGSPKPKPTIKVEKQNGNGGKGSAAESEQKALEGVKDKIARIIADTGALKQLTKDIKMTITPEGLLIQFIEAKGAVFFESGSATIRPDAMKIVAKIAPILAASKHKIEVQGHTDAQPFGGSVNGNWSLSTDRALALQSGLVQCSVLPEQFSDVKGLAATHLLDPAHPFSYINRRVTILLPREYTSDSMPSGPKDSLTTAMSEDNQPEAIMLKPKAPDLTTSKE